MGAKLLIAVAIIVALSSYKIAENILHKPEIPYIDPNPWWGPGEPAASEDPSIRQFTIDIPQQAVDDMYMRLGLPLRLSPDLEGANFTYGMNSDTLHKIVTHWQQSYNWKEREGRLNQYPHFKTQIEGLDIHFMRATPQVSKDKNVKIVPLLMVHGWPGSIVEFYGILPLLTSPQDGSSVVFEVICPSIPGYGFSQIPSKRGFDHLHTAQIFLKLMKRLGYEQFYVQGGDWGSLIVTDMATMYPSNILGVHLNMFSIRTLGSNLKMFLGTIFPSLVVSNEDSSKLYPLGEKFNFILRETGYMHLQATKPDTIGAALNQSPVSLAAYILEKFSTWTHQKNPQMPDGGLLQKNFPISLNEILDNVCVYWFTGTITSSMRFYSENIGKVMHTRTLDNIPCEVPAGLASFPEELLHYPKNFAAHKFYDIVTYTDQPAGGHFAALERPSLLAEDVHKFVTAVENRK